MNTTRAGAGRAAGFSLIELLIAMVVLSGVMASAISVMRSQSTGFRRGSTRTELTQNVRYSVSTLDRALRTLGSGVVPRQPMLVYGGNSVIVFNANYATDGIDVEDGNAVYANPDLPAGATIAIPDTAPLTIYGTAITYPSVNYTLTGGTPSRAETIMFFFTADDETTDPNDFRLMQQVNTQAPELVARNIRAHPTRPFFEYWHERVDSVTGVMTAPQLAAGRIPVRHTDPQHGSATDVGASALADSVKMIRVNLVVTNGAAGAEFRTQQLSTMVRVPNNGLVQLRACGDRPFAPGIPVATPNLPVDPPAVRLVWTPSADETGVQRDVSQYNVYYRLDGDPDWRVFTSIPAGSDPYDITHGENLVANNLYWFAVAAQDCTPKESALVETTAAVLIPVPGP